MNPIRQDAGSGKLILVVDDCRMTRRLLSMYLREAGYDVVLAVNGLDALETLSRESCVAMITDLNMPQMDGLELTRSIKNHPSFSRLPVIMLTTQGEERERQGGLEAGVSAFLTKPITQELLLKELDRVLPEASHVASAALS